MITWGNAMHTKPKSYAASMKYGISDIQNKMNKVTWYSFKQN